jgi:hypothetical protein
LGGRTRGGSTELWTNNGWASHVEAQLFYAPIASPATIQFGMTKGND